MTTATTERNGTTWSTGKPEMLLSTIKTLELLLTPLRMVDSNLLRTYYQQPETPADMISAVAVVETIGSDALEQRRRFNLIRSAISSYCAMVVEVPSIEVTTTGGTYNQRRSAEALGLFVDGVFAHNEMEEVAWQCTIDSCLARMGAVKVEVDGDDGVAIRRVPPHQIFWHPRAGQRPREFCTYTPVSRSSLLAKWGDDPEKRKAIEDAVTYRPNEMFDDLDAMLADPSTDMVGLAEGWRIAEPGAEPDSPQSGRYVAQIRSARGDVVLEDVDYPDTFHVIVPLRFEPAYNSAAGSPAGDVLWHYQCELDDFSTYIKEQFGKGGKFRVIADRNAELKPQELDLPSGAVVNKNPGTSVVFDRGTAPTPEMMNREEAIIRRAFEFMGLSYNAARGAKADGIASAKGQREVAAIAQNRIVRHMKGNQNWLVRIAKTVVGVADRHFEGKEQITVRVPGAKLLRRVTWSEINYQQGDFEFSCDAINALSRHPAARVDEVLELVQGKILDERQGLRAVGFKDLQYLRDQAFAVEDMAEQMIDLALSGDPRQPDPYMTAAGLQMLIDRGRERYLAEMVQKQPSEYLPELRRVIERAKALLKDMTQPPANTNAPDPALAAAAGAAGQPTATPGMGVPGAGLPELPAAAAPPPVPGQGVAV